MLFLTPFALAGDWHALRSPEADASSFLVSDWNRFTENYHPSYALDGNPKTAWVEGVAGDGVGEWLEWRVSPVSGVHRVQLRIRNGYQKSAGLFASNAAPARIRVDIRSSRGVVHSAEIALTDALDWQEHVLDPPEDVAFDTVRLTVLEARKGSTYADLCISDVELAVDATTPYQSAVENAKHVALQEWVKERVAAAAYFKALPKAWPFTGTHFGSKTLEDTPERLAALEALVSRLAEVREKAATEPVFRLALQHRVRSPDGLELPLAVMELLGDGVAWFESEPDAWRSVSYRPEGVWADSIDMSPAARLVEGEDSWLSFTQKTVSTERGVMTYTSRWSVHLVSGRPVAALEEKRISGTQVDITCGDIDERTLWELEWEGEKIARVRSAHGSRCTEEGPGTVVFGYLQEHTAR
ncbi:MAG: hypothetical protein R3F61_19890 [Myxococcota bacterium]